MSIFTPAQLTAAGAQALDAQDPLAPLRQSFAFPRHAGQSVAYFTGNSLGLMPLAARERVTEELDDWATHGVEGHFHARRPWFDYHKQLTEGGARRVGALPTEVVHMNSLTVNLHLLMVSFYRPTGSRTRILTEWGAFPSDRYAVVSQLQWHGLDPAEHLVELKPRPGESTLREEDMLRTIAELGDTLALVMLGGVNYYSGQVMPIHALTRAAHAVGAIAAFDLAHAAGNIDLHLHDWGVDFAAWCSYKYLNGGPGAISGAFVHERHARRHDLPRLAGWWGHDPQTRFGMGPDFELTPGAEGWQLSNPPVLAMAPLVASYALFDAAGNDALAHKRLHLTCYLEALLQQADIPGLTMITPVGSPGCQRSLRMTTPNKQVVQNLIAQGIVTDWREPDVIRVAPVPLYSSYADIWRLVEGLKAELNP